MPMNKGRLRKTKCILVELQTKAGDWKPHPIPGAAKRFSDSDFSDGLEVDVELDKNNKIVSVSIPGKPAVQPPPAAVKRPRHTQQFNRPAQTGHRPNRVPAPPNAQRADEPTQRQNAYRLIGQPFHNPYTFIPFQDEPVRQRKTPTLISADEIDRDRLTGVIELRVSTVSPLLSADPVPVSGTEGTHKTYQALKIGNDVIVPATGIRGALRTLLTILTSGTLGYMDKSAFLIQGRDTNLGPPSRESTQPLPERVYLGEVIHPGSEGREGTIRLGETRLVRLQDLTNIDQTIESSRSLTATPIYVRLDAQGRPFHTIRTKNADYPWRLRLSGRPVGDTEFKREAIFKPGEQIISIPGDLWTDYCGRNQFGARPVLQKGDLVWLQPAKNSTGNSFRSIQTADDVVGLHWARLGRTGLRLREKVPHTLHPDSLNRDGLVDEITDMFGQVADADTRDPQGFKATTFAGRVRPENLVFQDAVAHCQQITLAPLAPPHPGCLAFYRQNTDPAKVSGDDPLRGYKVYRTTTEKGAGGPWNYQVQGVYDRRQLKLPAQQKVNKTVSLVPPETVGTLRITYRSLSHRELSLLLQACELTWRLGGGKPLGLGHCLPSLTQIIDEFGNQYTPESLLGPAWRENVADIQRRVKNWQATQLPVQKLRYPRAVRGNARGGHSWFAHFASPRMAGVADGSPPKPGLQTRLIPPNLQQQATEAGIEIPDSRQFPGQILPQFSPDNPDSDVLYGYDIETP